VSRPVAGYCVRNVVLWTVIIGNLWSHCALAGAESADPTPVSNGETTDSLQEVLVTGTANSIKKLEASYNVVSVDAEAIKERNPKSVADLLKVSPGIWPETSGGQTGANIEVAGFPSGGDAPFFTNMIEGLPLYGMPTLSFMDSSSLMRLDDTVKRVEIVQGGPSAVLGPAQMGASANFILKRGSDSPGGSVGVTYGSEGLWRTDVFLGTRIVDGWYGSFGGFYRESDGVRSPQFEADKGGQFTATLSHDFDTGSVLIWGRILDDKNQFITPVPLLQSSTGAFSSYPGFCALACSYGSKAIENVTVPNPAGGFEQADLANGRGSNLYYLGAAYDQSIDAWNIQNNFLIDGGGLDTNALFSGANPRPLSYYLYGCRVPQPAGYCNGGTAVDANNLNGGQGFPVSYNISATYANGSPVSMNQSVIQQGWWYVQKSLQSITDELKVSRTLPGGDVLTGGVYLARYSMNDNWSLGNQMLMTNSPNARPILLSYQQNVHTYYLTSSQGFVNFNSNTNWLEHGDATNVAGYLSDSLHVGAWLLDAGVRLESIDARQRTCNTTLEQLGSQYDLYDDAVPICNGTWDYEHYETTRPTYTAGANYEFTEHASVYGRINTGVHFDDFDNGIRSAGGHFPTAQTVRNYEGGVKFQSRWIYLDLSAYRRVFHGLQYQETNSVGISTGAISTYGAKSDGVDLSATVSPIEHFDVRIVADYMDGTYDDYKGCAPYVDIFGRDQCAQVNGKPLQRQPRFHAQVTPTLLWPTPAADFAGWVTYEYVGQRYEDIFGLQPLGTYYMLSAGIVADVGKHWQFRIQGTNLTNQIGLTEGNARKEGVATGIDGVLLARPIEGREYNFSVYCKF
jgi:outer membrane cobalamin receptor